MKIATVTMFRFVATSCLVAAACGQQFVNPKDAKILKEQRFNAGDGRHGAAFAQQDGTVFREESTADGERIGQYSYIDQDGNTITVRYTAGKDGFRILEGAHIPEGANGQNSAPFAAENAAPRAAAPVQPAAPVIVQQQPAPQTIDYDYVDEPVDPNFNPFINPHDPTHRDFRFNTNGANFAPKSAPAPAQTNNFGVPDCANCAGVNPFINPFDASHQQAGLLAGHQAGFRAPAQPAQPRPRPVQQTFTVQTTTQAAPRFFPPGNLQLNRFETGFNFDFSSQ